MYIYIFLINIYMSYSKRSRKSRGSRRRKRSQRRGGNIIKEAMSATEGAVHGVADATKTVVTGAKNVVNKTVDGVGNLVGTAAKDGEKDTKRVAVATGIVSKPKSGISAGIHNTRVSLNKGINRMNTRIGNMNRVTSKMVGGRKGKKRKYSRKTRKHKRRSYRQGGGS